MCVCSKEEICIVRIWTCLESVFFREEEDYEEDDDEKNDDGIRTQVEKTWVEKREGKE